MRKIFAVVLTIFIFSGVSAAQNRIGLDRIDAMIRPSAIGDLPRFLMEQAAGTEVKNIKPWAWWGGIDPFPPTAQKPREENGYWVVPGIRMEGWHRYKFEELDRVMNAAKMYNLSVALAIHGPPKWPRGDDVCEYDFGTYHPCGVIKQSHFEIFRNALFDFAYYLALRYPDVKYFIAYNEPNLPYAFLPEKPYPGGTLLNAYIELAYWPISDGVRATGREVYVVGPEITLLNVENEFGKSRWLEDWIEPMLEYYPNLFDVVGVHNYAVDANQTLEKTEKLRKVFEKFPHATQRIWLTEYNFGTQKESLTRTDMHIFSQLAILYSNQWWERSYLFTMMDSLIFTDEANFGQRKPLYDLFKLLVQHFN